MNMGQDNVEDSKGTSYPSSSYSLGMDKRVQKGKESPELMTENKLKKNLVIDHRKHSGTCQKEWS